MVKFFTIFNLQLARARFIYYLLKLINKAHNTVYHSEAYSPGQNEQSRKFKKVDKKFQTLTKLTYKMIAGAMENCYAAMEEEACLKSLFNNDYFWL